jgi:hypothetical protein
VPLRPRCSGNDGDYCPCNGECCGEPGDCFVTVDNNDKVIGEFCCNGSGRFICGDLCCDSEDCSSGCARQTARAISYRRPGR